jgi:pimeloyl-ACP methyl ester carboxylesterase
VDRKEASAGVPWYSRFTLALWRRIPLFLHLAMWWLALNARLVPRLVLRFARLRLPRVDQEIVDRPEMRAMRKEALQGSFRQGERGAAHELGLFARPWDFELAEITAEVWLWHGDNDYVVPASMGRYAAKEIPNCRATIVPGAGHLWVFDHFDEVLAKLR